MKFLDYKLFESIVPDVILDFPELRQVYNYDCGACALQQVLIYYGIEKREGQLIKKLSTVKTDMIEHGTKLSAMKSLAKYYGLEAEVLEELTIDDIKKYIDDKIPPILLMQAWTDYSEDDMDWEDDFNDGHYVVAIGYNDDCIFFEDPSSVVRTYVTYKELEERWHDLADDNKTKIYQVAVVIKGEKKYDSEEIVHMD